MKIRYLLGALVIFLFIAGCGTDRDIDQDQINDTDSSDTDMPPPVISGPSDNLDNLIVDDTQLPADTGDTTDTTHLIYPNGDIDDKTLCPADVFLTYIKCEKVDEGTVAVEVINQYQELIGLVYYAYDGAENVGKTGLVSETFANKERKKWNISVEALRDQFGPFERIQITPVIVIEGGQRACINKKLSLNLETSCRYPKP